MVWSNRQHTIIINYIYYYIITSVIILLLSLLQNRYFILLSYLSHCNNLLFVDVLLYSTIAYYPHHTSPPSHDRNYYDDAGVMQFPLYSADPERSIVPMSSHDVPRLIRSASLVLKEFSKLTKQDPRFNGFQTSRGQSVTSWSTKQTFKTTRNTYANNRSTTRCPCKAN